MGQYADLIGLAIAAVLMVGSGVANWLKQQREKSEAERRVREQREQVQLRTQLPREAPATLDDAASQRREQLRQLALQRQRQQAAGGGSMNAPMPAGAEPTNLTMAERIARARAKEQYAQRAEALRRQREASASQAEDPRASQRVAAERARQEARARAQLEAERAREERARRAREQAQRAEQEKRRQRREPATRGPARPRERAAAAAPVARKSLVGTIAAGSAAAHATPLAHAVQVGSVGGGMTLDRAALRQAIILKEVLDRPLALRGPVQQGSFGQGG